MTAAGSVATCSFDRIDTMAGPAAGYGGVHRSERGELHLGERSDPISDSLEAAACVPWEFFQSIREDRRRQVAGLPKHAVPETSGVFTQGLLAAGADTLDDGGGLRENLLGHAFPVSGPKLFGPTAREQGLAHRSAPSSGLASMGRRRTRRLR